MRWARVHCVLFLTLLAGSWSVAQRSAGSIFGSVTDPSGAVIPGATVAARRIENGWERQAFTDGRGEFHLAGLMPGQWELQVALAGFRASRSRIFLDVNQQF